VLLQKAQLMPVHKLVVVMRERGELLVIRERLRKKCAYLHEEKVRMEGIRFADEAEYEKGLAYYDWVLAELAATIAEGKAVNAEIEALPQAGLALKEMAVADAELAVAELLSQFVKLMGIDSDKNKLGGLAGTASVIVNEFGWLTAEGLAVVLRKALTGEKTIYGTFNLPTLCKWIREYKEELDEAWANQSVQLHVQSKGEGNRGWEQREARKEANARHAKLDRVREEAEHRVNVQEYVKQLRGEE